ncbi:MAG TPA: hypothetical protein VJA26_08440, partial [Gammaproteobacteria bacterium]|nr:hypothetical protein [Gammaproteobacteria bacterium]
MRSSLRREDTATRFSFPIKFAEYLAGNRIIISRNAGDCSRFVEERNAGVVLDDSERAEALLETLPEVPVHEKRRLTALAASDLDKNEIYGRYLASLG